MATEQSRKRHITQIDFEEGEKVLVTNWIHQINIKRPCYCREKQLKGTKTSKKREIQYQDKDWEDSS